MSARASAVSRPSIPGGAWSKGCSFASCAWGAWSVAIASTDPSARPTRTAATSASVRNGGFTLNTGSNDAHSACVNVKWCVVASAVTGTPFARAARTIAIEPAVDRCWKWTRAASEPRERDVAHHHQLLGLRALARDPEPARPLALVHVAARGERLVLTVLRQDHAEVTRRTRARGASALHLARRDRRR